MSALPQPEQPTLPFVDPDLMRIAKAVSVDFADRQVPEDERPIVRRTYTVRRFYEEWLLDERRKRVAAGKLSRGSLAKDRQALNRWAAVTRPGPNDWPAGKPWDGVPLGFITDGYLDDFCDKLRSQYAEATAYSTWTHLRTILNAAVKLKALDVAPAPKEPPQLTKEGCEMYGLSLEPDGELTRAYRALAVSPAIQTAFVLSVNAGPRPVDLFLLRWEQFTLDVERPAFEFVSRKTGKQQRVPLAACTIRHLQKLRVHAERDRLFAVDELVFPGLSNPKAADPEKSREARRRNATVKKLLAAAGIGFKKPWQAGRACCNERYESHREGSGQFLLGHAKTLNARSYRAPSHLIYQAVQTLPQPACFLEG